MPPPYHSRMSETAPFHSVRERAGHAGSEAARVYRVCAAQPSWAVRLGATLAAVVVVLIALALIVPAILVFLAILALGAGVQTVRRGWNRLTGASSRDAQGRRNVRIIVREHAD